MLEGDRGYVQTVPQPERRETIVVSITLRGRFDSQDEAVAFITAAHAATDETHSEVASVTESRDLVSGNPGSVYR